MKLWVISRHQRNCHCVAFADNNKTVNDDRRWIARKE